MGIYLGRYWRDATDGYFSYLMDPDGVTDTSLRVTYFGNDAAVNDMDRAFDILIDDQLLTGVTLTGGQGDVFVDVNYQIPGNLIGDGSPVRVKFQSHTNAIAGGVYGVRLIRN